MLRTYDPFKQWLLKKIERIIAKSGITGSSVVDTLYYNCQDTPLSHDLQLCNGKQNEYYATSASSASLANIYNGLCHLHDYKGNCLRNIDTVMLQRYAMLTKKNQRDLKKIGYLDNIDKVKNGVINVNCKTVEKISATILNSLDKTNDSTGILSDLKAVFEKKTYKTFESCPNYRITEALSHIIRDWHTSFDKEREPLLSYIEDQLKKIDTSNNKRTLIIMPGSGLGRIPYEISLKYSNIDIHSIEFSNLAYMCNEFIYLYEDKIQLSPYLTYFSNHVSLNDQLSTFDINLSGYVKPANLKIHLGDFNKFTIPNENAAQYDNIVVITVFFIDTASNIIDYIDTIESFKRNCLNKVHWINVGPLKYGTKPMVQLDSKSFDKLRKIRNWKDLDSQIDHTNVGYMTDEKSLYKGYYSLYKFHSSIQS
ncbi:uncharacterized protein SCODWIG_00087 [Saccharomycodes ludwigii]|uniref:Uncharacterized protein n=1 Tax=Saccharomycodes ludwigii TaxID=36035 RepID=A0A376B0W3_9ASCO|nr:hypothetical protein SCDLUD_002208 [Saccharomycodes ludwigii]KAH3902387.1 hypothetical protein SCDLUD_002208 [Saccharomycodes ludwigii]SSD58326.1 uncharacterized protein SCODWIG_00087 [Saccharomycodes ludwigii]